MPQAAWGGVLVAVAILYGAWQEFKAKNRRDARLLALTGAISIAGSAAVIYL
jgi:drug/metabolite transporter superfamily protein YnfA